MWLADRWKDYEVIDCSCGEKLERWSKYILLRPDPQVIWDTPKTNKNWKKLNGLYHRSKKGGGEWEFFDLPQEWTINYSLPINKELTFHLKPFSFKHTGLFPEQAANWDWFSKKIYDAKKSGAGIISSDFNLQQLLEFAKDYHPNRDFVYWVRGAEYTLLNLLESDSSNYQQVLFNEMYLVEEFI